MSERDRPSENPRPLDPPADALSLDAIAVIDAFAAACERGESPPLSEWLKRYPDHAAPLADYAAAMFSEPEAVSDTPDASMKQHAGTLSPGTRRALDTLFGSSLPRVAEAPASYTTHPLGLLALADARGMNLRQLALALDLSPQFVLWLDHAAISLDQQPGPLVQSLAQALGGADAGTITEALAIEGDIASDTTAPEERAPRGCL